MGKIPDFNSYGNLPAGVYTVSLDDILARFLLPKSNQRKVLTASLEQFISFAKAHAEAILIDGSYTTQDVALQQGENKLILRFTLGQFEYKGKTVIIDRLDVEDRKIVAQVEGRTSDVDDFVNDLIDVFRVMSKNKSKKFLEPLYETYESEVLANLEIDFNEFFARPFLNSVKDFFQDRSIEQVAKARIIPTSINFDIDYTAIDPQHLSDNRIALVRKRLSIEPRRGIPLSERSYHSRAPLNSEAHISLLSQIEDSFK